MKILFTGGSSFTGCWFIQELAAAGHEVTAVFRKSPEEYFEAIRRRRRYPFFEVQPAHLQLLVWRREILNIDCRGWMGLA